VHLILAVILLCLEVLVDLLMIVQVFGVEDESAWIKGPGL